MKEILKSYQKYKYIHFLLFFVPIVVVCCLNLFAGPDFWFLHEYGKHIVSDGIAHTDFLSMHSGLHLVMQQWLSSVIFYLIYHFLGRYGMIVFVMAIIACYLAILYHFISFLTNKDSFLSTIFSVLTVLLLEVNFVLIRPQLFTYLILLCALFVMEVYSKNQDTKWIYGLLVLAFLQVNLHSALYIGLFLFVLPYLVSFLLKKDKRWKKLIFIMLLMGIVGFLNPYGGEVFTFLIKSYGRSDFSDFIMEMRPTSLTFDYPINVIFYLSFFGMIVFYFYSKKRIELPHLFLFLGTSILAFFNTRNIALFFLGTIPFLPKTITYKKVPSEGSIRNYLPLYCFMLGVCFFYLFINRSVDTSEAEKAVDYLDSLSSEIVLYADFDYGSYCEYRGYPSYIDSRAEVYFKSLNQKFDYFSEYYQLEHGRGNVSEFISKYGFTHLFVQKDKYMDLFLRTDADYENVYSDSKFNIYQIKK